MKTVLYKLYASKALFWIYLATCKPERPFDLNYDFMGFFAPKSKFSFLPPFSLYNLVFHFC